MMHANFDDIYSRIENLYQTCPQSRIDSVRGGIVMILREMTMDSVLRDKFFEKGQDNSFSRSSFFEYKYFSGVLDLIFPLFNSLRTRQLAAQAISSMCGHDHNFKVLYAIYKQSNYIAGFIHNSLDDSKLTLFGISTLTNCMESVFWELVQSRIRGERLVPTLQSSVDIVPILEMTVDLVKRHNVHPTYIFDRALDFLSFTTLVGFENFKSYPREYSRKNPKHSLPPWVPQLRLGVLI